MSDFPSRRAFHALQTDEKIDIIFYVLAYRIKTGNWPSFNHVKQWWLAQS